MSSSMHCHASLSGWSNVIVSGQSSPLHSALIALKGMVVHMLFNSCKLCLVCAVMPGHCIQAQE